MRRRRGVALVLVLWLVVVLGAIGGRVVHAARGSSNIALNMRAGLLARYAAESGIESFVAAIEDTLALLNDSVSRREWLNALEGTSAEMDSINLGEARFAVVAVDVSSRLDVNSATEEALRVFFSQFGDATQASEIARRVRQRIELGTPDARPDDHVLQRGPTGGLRAVQPILSLEELRGERIVPEEVLERAARYLTVDGDGTINRMTASDTVLVAASGDLRNEPSRLLLVSRGWMAGHPLTHEIQSLYAISGNGLVHVRWREQTR